MTVFSSALLIQLISSFANLFLDRVTEFARLWACEWNEYGSFFHIGYTSFVPWAGHVSWGQEWSLVVIIRASKKKSQ